MKKRSIKMTYDEIDAYIKLTLKIQVEKLKGQTEGLSPVDKLRLLLGGRLNDE